MLSLWLPEKWVDILISSVQLQTLQALEVSKDYSNLPFTLISITLFDINSSHLCTSAFVLFSLSFSFLLRQMHT